MEKIEFKNNMGQSIIGLLSKKGDKGIIYCHGFKGCKEEKLSQVITEKLAKDFTTLAFDFSNGLGESDGEMENITVSHYVEDLISAIDYLQRGGIKKIGVIGHSLGGMVILIAASKDKRINCLASLAGVFDFGLLRRISLEKDKLTVEEWKKRRYARFHSDSKNIDVKVNYKFYEDGIKYGMRSIVSSLKIPILVVHANKDDKVTFGEHTQQIFELVNGQKKLRRVDADHGFEGKEEFVANLCLKWFEEHLE